MGTFVSGISLVGLAADVIGFTLIGRELLKRPGNRPFWSNEQAYPVEVGGFALVILGFLFQAAAQVVSLFYS